MELEHSRLTTANPFSNDSVSEVNAEKPPDIRGRKRTLGLVCVTGFWGGCAYSLMTPFMPQEAKLKGLSSIETGIIFSVYQLVIFVASPFIANYLSRLGSKFVIVFSLFVCGLFTTLFGLAPWIPSRGMFFISAMALRMMDAAGGAGAITAAYAIATNAFPDHISLAFGLVQTSISFGLIVAPAIGGFLYEAGGFWLPFVSIGSSMILFSLALQQLLPPVHDVQTQRKTSILSLLRLTRVWVINLCIFNSAIGCMFLGPTFSLHLKQFGMTTLLIGLMFTISPMAYGLSAPFWGYVSDKTEMYGPFIVIGNFLAGIGVLLIGPSSVLSFLPKEVAVIGTGLAFMGLFNNCGLIPTRKCLLISALNMGFENNIDTHGIVSGLFNSVFCLGAFVGPLLSGVVVQELGFQRSTTVFASFFFVSTICSGIYFLIDFLRKGCNVIRSEEPRYERIDMEEK